MAETPHLLPTAAPVTSEPVCYSDDQDAAYNRIAELLAAAGVDVKAETAEPKDTNTTCKMLFVIGKAGSGKTMLLADIADALVKTGVEVVS
ncbi:MAG: ATPase, partial [Proteobacteria bacterium]|nr:ATPase [Pseudomonadota bacterium]